MAGRDRHRPGDNPGLYLGPNPEFPQTRPDLSRILATASPKQHGHLTG